MKTLARADWEAAALAALAEEGLAAVAVEPLARRLKVTKGSFYWHFADRKALLGAVLARWEEEHTEAVIARLGDGDDARARLAGLLRAALHGKRAARLHLALAGARGEPAVAAALARVSRRRVAFIAACLGELGFAPAEAERRAQLCYAVYVGLMHYREESPGAFPTRAALDEWVEHAVVTLLGR